MVPVEIGRFYFVAGCVFPSRSAPVRAALVSGRGDPRGSYDDGRRSRAVAGASCRSVSVMIFRRGRPASRPGPFRRQVGVRPRGPAAPQFCLVHRRKHVHWCVILSLCLGRSRSQFRRVRVRDWRASGEALGSRTSARSLRIKRAGAGTSLVAFTPRCTKQLVECEIVKTGTSASAIHGARARQSFVRR